LGAKKTEKVMGRNLGINRCYLITVAIKKTESGTPCLSFHFYPFDLIHSITVAI